MIICDSLWKLATLLNIRFEASKNKLRIRIQSTICWIKTQKRIEAEKNGDKNGKELHKLMNNAVYGKEWKT